MKTTVGMFLTQGEAENALEELVRAGVPNKDLSYIHLKDDKIVDEKTGAKVGDSTTNAANVKGILAEEGAREVREYIQ